MWNFRNYFYSSKSLAAYSKKIKKLEKIKTMLVYILTRKEQGGKDQENKSSQEKNLGTHMGKENVILL